MDGDPGLPHTEVRPTSDEPAGDEDASQYEPTSRANSQVARELIKKGQALSSQGPESLRSRSDQSGARSPSPVGSDRHRHGDIVMYDPQTDLARGHPMPQSMNQFNQHVANVHLDPSMTINQDVTNYQQINATQNNAQFNQFVNQDTGPMVAQMAEARRGEIIAGLQSQSEAMRREIQMNAEQRVNTMKSEREAEMKYQNAMNTISEQERQIRELRAMVEQMMQNQQQPPAQPAPAPMPPVQQAPATPLAIPTIPLAASPPGLSNASSHSWTKVGSDPYGKDGSVPAGAVDDAATGDGWPGDDGDGGNDKDKKKKKKKKKKDRSRRRRRDPSSSPSSSSSSTSTASDESFRRKLLKHLGNSSDPTGTRSCKGG